VCHGQYITRESLAAVIFTVRAALCMRGANARDYAASSKREQLKCCTFLPSGPLFITAVLLIGSKAHAHSQLETINSQSRMLRRARERESERLSEILCCRKGRLQANKITNALFRRQFIRAHLKHPGCRSK
jgi:hypothetical protein